MRLSSYHVKGRGMVFGLPVQTQLAKDNPMKISIKPSLLRRLSRAIFPMGLMLSPIWAQAADLHHWVSHQDGIYENEAAWVPAAVPDGENATALFGQATDLTIGLQNNHTLAELLLANQTNVTFKTANPTGSGERGDNKYISAQNANVDNAFLRFHSVGADTADVTLHVQDVLNVDGNVHVVHGARISARDINLGTNPAIPTSGWISGTDSATGPSRVDATTIKVGEGASASLLLDSGALLNSHIAYVGRNVPLNDDSLSRIEVSGKGAKGSALWDARAVVVGEKGIGRVSAVDGGVVDAQTIVLGTGPSNEPGDLGLGMADVVGTNQDGTPATMNVDAMYIGVRGSGFLSVADGGKLNTGEVMFARQPGSVAEMDLHATNQSPVAEWRNTGDVSVGGDFEAAGGSADIQVRQRSVADVRGELKVWPGSSVSVEGGTLAANRMYVESGAEFKITDGTIQLDEYEGVDLLQRGGTIAPGPGANKSLILTNFTQRGGATTAIEIGGTEAGESYDRVAIDGNAIIDGTLQLSLIDGFVPAAEDIFSVVTSNLLFGSYQNVTNGGRVATEDGLASFVVNFGLQSMYDPNQVVLSDFMRVILGDFNADGTLSAADIDMLQIGVKDTKFDLTKDGLVDVADRSLWAEQAGTTLGDANLDSEVDFQDFLVLSDSFGSKGGWAEGDFDGSGDIAFGDFLILADHFGQTSGAVGASAVPEPAAGLMAGFALLGMLGFRRRS